jgi:NAD(P)-dependent dehydrogenase (short-subunit alcohol dehydrogenase family)
MRPEDKAVIVHGAASPVGSAVSHACGDERARVLLAERTRSRQEPVPAAGCGRGARLMAETTPRILSVEAARAYPRRWPVALAFAAGLQGRRARRSEGTSR